MRKWLVLLLLIAISRVEGMVPLQQTTVPLKTDVRVKTSRRETVKDEYSGFGMRESSQKNITEKTFLSIEVRNLSGRLLKELKIVYRFFDLQFDRSTNERLILTRRMADTEKLIASGSGELTIADLKPLEKKVVETEPYETSYRSTQDLTKFIPRTKTTGTKFGGYIVEYFVAGQLVKRDASTRRLHEAYLRSIRAPGANSLRMKVGK